MAVIAEVHAGNARLLTLKFRLSSISIPGSPFPSVTEKRTPLSSNVFQPGFLGRKVWIVFCDVRLPFTRTLLKSGLGIVVDTLVEVIL